MSQQENVNELSNSIEEENDIYEILKLWEQNFNSQNFDPEPFVRRLAEVFQAESSKYMLKDPDPFDERHPSRTDPTCDWGKNLKTLFKKENFMTRLVNDYLRENFFTRQNIDKSSFQLNIAACRLILIIMPGLETSAVFQVSNDHLINRLYDWVENAEEPLKSYATGLLGAAMDIQEIAIAYREQNIRILPILLQRLKQSQIPTEDNTLAAKDRNESIETANEDRDASQRNTIALFPLTLATRQMLILHYLTPMGEYQEFLPFIFELNAIDIIFGFLEKKSTKNASLTFEALKYLASLLCHKKCCLEFLIQNGIQKLLKLPKISIVSTGAAIALYYIAYCEEAMERICSMTPRIISELVSYVLSLLGCIHDSGRCHATMFLGFCFQFKIMLDEFDKQDGLRQLYNVISILPILANSNEDDYNLSADEENAERQVIRHVCVAMKKYFESHIFYKYTQVTRNSPSGSIPSRALKSSQEVINDQIMNLQNILPMKANFQPVNLFLQLGGVKLFVLIIAHSYEWNYSGRAETVRSALDVLNICCVLPKVHAVLCERIDFPGDAPATAALNIILGASEGEIVADSEVQKSALSLLVNCVCAPINRISGSLARFGSTKKKITDKNSEEMIQKVWETVRSNNGIIVLLQLITTKTPITDADMIRGMACRALAGLARSETVRQIISKLPLFVNGQLQQLMRDPILQEKRSEHVNFQKYALELIERISGKPINVDTSMANIHKSNVVAQTKIHFNDKQLYMLIYRHLVENGLASSADSLMREAKLEGFKPQQNDSVHSPFVSRSPMIQRSRINKKNIDNTVHPIQELLEVPSERNKLPLVPLTPTAIKLVKKTPIPQSPLAQTPNALEKQATSDIFIPFSTSHKNSLANVAANNITLNTIVTEYLTNQHSLCKNPMSTCPTFNLFQPHKCPDPKSGRNAFAIPMNIASRHFKRQQGSVTSSRKFDRRFVHSNFDALRTLRVADVDICFTVCDFHKTDENAVIAGTHNGEVRVMHLNDTAEDYSVSCSDSYINNVICSRNGELVLTSSTWHPPLSALWSIGDKQFFSKLTFDEEEYVEFNNLSQDRVLGTKGERATIYDITTGQVVQTLQPNIFNQYSKNRATFSPSDELILSDGVLWDVKSGVQIHKFDKLNNQLSGVFHPNGNEILSNSEIWDLRTFHLMRTIPALDQCQIRFSPLNTLYAYNIHMETSDDEKGYESSFKVLDSFDYSSISTIDTRKSIYDLVVANNGCQLAICENQGGYESVSESVIRIYAVGRKRDPEDEEIEDDMGSDEEEDGLDSMSDGEENEFENRSRRRRINLNRDLDDVLDVISLTTESLSSDGAPTLEDFSSDLDSDENGDVNMENEDGDSSWETDDD